MDDGNSVGIDTPQSDSGSDVDIMAYSDNDEDFQTVVWGRGREGRRNHGDGEGAMDVCNGSMSCVVETNYRTSCVESEKQQPEFESCRLDLSRGSGNGVSLRDAPPKESDGVGDDDTSAGIEDGVSLGYDPPPEKQDFAGGDVSPDVDSSDSCFDAKDSENTSERAASESASEWSPTSDNSDSEEASKYDVSVRSNISLQSDFSEELDVDGISSEDEDGLECGLKYGSKQEIPRDTVTEESQTHGHRSPSRIPEDGINEDVTILSPKSITFDEMSPNLHKTSLGNQTVYTKSRITACKVVLGRLPTVDKNFHATTHGHGVLAEKRLTETDSYREQVELTSDIQSDVSGNEDSGSDSKNYLSVSTSSKTKSLSIPPRIVRENSDPTDYRQKLTTSKHVDDYFEKRNGQFVCKICGVTYAQRMKLKLHINVHTEKYKCTKCDKVFAHKFRYKEHVLKHPNESCFMFVCEICGKGFKQASNRKTHMTMIHSGERNFVCNICGTRWKRSYDLHKHRRLVHEGIKPKVNKPSTGKKRSPCPVCGGMFTELQSHMRKHTGEKPYQCNICERRFAASNTLVAHQRTHTGDRPYKCTQCDKTFTQNSHRSTHVKQVHSHERNYKCETCGKAFKSSSHLRLHNDTHANSLSFICQICSVGFRSKRLLQSHMTVHKVEKRFECHDCKVTFRWRESYRSHMKVHRQQWVHKCASCGAGFVRKDTYLNHLKKHKTHNGGS